MSRESDHYRKVFALLIEADEKLWQAVAAIQDEEGSALQDMIGLLMQARGRLHVDCFRPMYQRYPELASEVGMSEQPGP